MSQKWLLRDEEISVEESSWDRSPLPFLDSLKYFRILSRDEDRHGREETEVTEHAATILEKLSSVSSVKHYFSQSFIESKSLSQTPLVKVHSFFRILQTLMGTVKTSLCYVRTNSDFIKQVLVAVLGEFLQIFSGRIFQTNSDKIRIFRMKKRSTSVFVSIALLYHSALFVLHGFDRAIWYLSSCITTF